MRLAPPRQLTNWNSSCLNVMSVTADGKRLVFLKWIARMSSYVGDLKAAGTQLYFTEALSFERSSDGIADWTADSKSVIVVSNRSGHFALYKQSLDEDTPERWCPRATAEIPTLLPMVRAFCIWDVANMKGAGDGGGAGDVGSSNGGPSRSLFLAKPWSTIMCARSKSSICAIAEPSEDKSQLILTVIDPAQGRGPELIRFPLDPKQDDWWADLSPDGTQVAVTRSPAGPLNILSLKVAQPVKWK